MTWRSIMISRPASLRRTHASLAIIQEQTVYIPFEDIAVLVLNHREITLTHAVLATCAEYGIGVFSIGDNHMPNGIFTPFLQHSRATRTLRLQLQLPRPPAKRIWTSIVRRKIENQASCLQLAGIQGSDYLLSFVNKVRSGDTGNLEGVAAAWYFPRLFGSGFTRSQQRLVNSALNYGYAILRGAIARGLVAHGLLPSLGIFHSSEQNAFNLADDVIEPFRPVIDLIVAGMAYRDTDDLTPEDKAMLVNALNIDIDMPRGRMSVLSAIEQCIESLVRAYEPEHDTPLELPRLCGLEIHDMG